MIALRKDVKVGFMIGGVVLGVFGVYLGLSALAGEKPNPSMTGANLELTPFGSTASTPGAGTSVADRSSTGTPKQTAPTNSMPPAKNSATNPPAVANAGQQAPTNAGTDMWSNAFDTGSLQPVVTVTPDATKTTPTGPKPADVITAINTPPAKIETAEPTQPKTQPEPGTGTASANDTSGSIVDLTSSSLTKAADPAPAGDVKTHTIEVGETFTSIAAEYYGDGKYYQAIINANPQIDPNKLKPGMTIKVPPLAKKEPRTDTVDVPAESKIDPTKQYIVKTGDSLHKIASSLYGDSAMWQKIYDLNKSAIGDSPAKLKLGMVLNLPSAPTRTP